MQISEIHPSKIAEGTRDELLQTCEEFRLMWEALCRTEKRAAETSPALV